MSDGELCGERHPITRSACRLAGKHGPQHETREGMKFLGKDVRKAIRYVKREANRAARRGNAFAMEAFTRRKSKRGLSSHKRN